MVHDAVLRNLEVIGEAARRLDDAYTKHTRRVPGAPWQACEVFSSTKMRALTWRGFRL
jgi:uncharacterized protein with HEPN domain